MFEAQTKNDHGPKNIIMAKRRSSNRAPRTLHLYAVILAGGSGTRFWPLSRQLYPKQLLRIIGDETLIQQTMRRVLRSVPADHVLISTNPGQADSIRVQLSEWKDALAGNFVIEPEAKNTAPALALAAAVLARRDPDAVMLVLPADHVITQDARFHAAVGLGTQLAEMGCLVTFGVRPIRPETGYGYIHPNVRSQLAAAGGLKGYAVARFVEKPDMATALKYLKAGTYYWNSGIFMWRVGTFLKEVMRHQPQLGKGIERIERLLDDTAPDSRVSAAYKRLPSISVDYGVMERSKLAAMIPVDFHWSDVGNWSSLEEVAPRDAAGNVVSGKVVDLDSRNSILYGDRRLVATIGLSDMVVVDTPDATLICPKDRSQDVKRIVEVLKQRGAPEHLEHRTVFRPWGSYTVLEEGPGYKVKRVTVNPHGRLSLQLHHQRSEHWVVTGGVARVTRGEQVFDLTVGQSTAIPKETAHRLENPGTEALHIIEVQNGPYLGEDDIVRLHDDYGRIKK
jgi:mannose-1-phosphate guanylyltransferase/mannose-6-phosphate isomerase